MQSGALLTEAGFRYQKGKFSSHYLLSLKISSQMFSIFLAVLFSTAFFLNGGSARRPRS